MRNSLARSIVALVLAQQLLSPAFVFSQQEVRQRRTQTQAEPEERATVVNAQKVA